MYDEIYMDYNVFSTPIDVKGEELQIGGEFFLFLVDYVFRCRISINDKGGDFWNYWY
jgi:hypothetical protein